MANPVLHYKKSQGHRSWLNAPNKHKQEDGHHHHSQYDPKGENNKESQLH
jgi:hypothetical protein